MTDSSAEGLAELARKRPSLGMSAELVGPIDQAVIHVTINQARVLSLVESEARDLAEALRMALGLLDAARGIHDVPVPFTDPEAYAEHRRTCGLCRRLGD